jgi:DNA modification methylase
MTDDPTAAPAAIRASELAIEQRPIADLKPFGRKARHHPPRQMAAIKESLTAFGFVSPVLIDAKGRILAGNARIEAAKALGLTQVPAVVVDHLTAEEKRAYVLADNRLAELGAWNREVLKLELEELSLLELDFSLEATGFSLPEIEAITLGAGPGSAAEDEIPKPPVRPVSQVGDLWRLGDHRLLVGDATSEAVLDRLMAGELARMVFTDPPYNVPIQGHVTGSKAHGAFVQACGEMSDAEFTSFLTAVCGQAARVLVEGGLAFVCMDWRHMAHVLEAAKAVQLAQINHCVWDKGTAGMGSLYRSQHELIFVLRKGGAPHLNNVALGRNGRNRSNVWSYPGVNGFGADKAREREMHPTVKPLALVKDAILDVTKKGEVVLDLFGGSGTTLIAAEVSGRRARLTELDPRYADVIIKRWEGVSGAEAVHAVSGQTWRALSLSRAQESQDQRAA